MPNIVPICLKARGVVSVCGEDRIEFLQGLVSNDVTKVKNGHAAYAALLTAQGRVLHDFIIFGTDDTLFLDCEGGTQTSDLIKRLSLYKLRSDVTLENVSDQYAVMAFLNGAPEDSDTQTSGAIVCPDPRHPKMGWRGLVPVEKTSLFVQDDANQNDNLEGYERLRLSLGIPDGSRDMEEGKALPLEYGFDELGGVDWEKGCYMGQEVTARMKHRSHIKKKLMSVSVEGPLPEPGTAVMMGETQAGEIRTGKGDLALAILRLETVAESEKTGNPLTAGEATLRPFTAPTAP